MGEDSTPSLISRTSIIVGLVIGLLHAGVAVLLWDYFGFDNLRELVVIKPLIGGYLLLGMFVLGFVPALFYIGRKFISPAAVVGGLLLLSVLWSFLSGPVRAPAGTPAPFGFYILFWVGVVVLAGLVGGFEHKWKQPATG
jgi:hypothetical protein